MTVRSEAGRRFATIVLSGVALAKPGAASAAQVSSPPNDFFQAFQWWWARSFQIQPLTAWDYILIIVALAAGVATAVFYYRWALLPAAIELKSPKSVKLRSLFLGLAVFCLLLMLSPHLPIGLLVVLTLIFCAMAIFMFGLAVTIGGAFLLATLILIILWTTGWLAGVIG